MYSLSFVEVSKGLYSRDLYICHNIFIKNDIDIKKKNIHKLYLVYDQIDQYNKKYSVY